MGVAINKWVLVLAVMSTKLVGIVDIPTQIPSKLVGIVGVVGCSNICSYYDNTPKKYFQNVRFFFILELT